MKNRMLLICIAGKLFFDYNTFSTFVHKLYQVKSNALVTALETNSKRSSWAEGFSRSLLQFLLLTYFVESK